MIFSDKVMSTLNTRPDKDTDEQLIREVLAQDPRPAYKTKRTTERAFGMRLGDYEVKWLVKENVTQVIKLNIIE